MIFLLLEGVTDGVTGGYFAIEVHIRVDGQITVSRAHELTKEIENKLRLKFGPTTHIILHVEPIKEKKDE